MTAFKLTAIVSGGQAGADRGALQAAIDLGLGWGGWSPAGWRADDGAIPEIYRERMKCTTSPEYGMRYKITVRGDATVPVGMMRVEGSADGAQWFDLATGQPTSPPGVPVVGDWVRWEARRGSRNWVEGQLTRLAEHECDIAVAREGDGRANRGGMQTFGLVGDVVLRRIDAPTSLTPAGRMEAVLDLARRGEITQEQARKLLEMPDIEPRAATTAVGERPDSFSVGDRVRWWPHREEVDPNTFVDGAIQSVKGGYVRSLAVIRAQGRFPWGRTPATGSIVDPSVSPGTVRRLNPVPVPVPVDPLDVEYDHVTLRELLERDAWRRRDEKRWAIRWTAPDGSTGLGDCYPTHEEAQDMVRLSHEDQRRNVRPEYRTRYSVANALEFTPAQRAAVSAYWSAQLRARMEASKERDRQRVVVDHVVDQEID